MIRMEKARELPKMIVCLLIALLMGTAMTAEANETERNRYEMDIVLDEQNPEKSRLVMTLRAEIINDSEDVWSEVCFRDYMSSLYQWYAYDIDPDEYDSGVSRAYQDGVELNVRTEGTEAGDFSVADDSIIYVSLSEPLPPGERAALTLEYSADIMPNTARCAYYPLNWHEEGARTYELAQFYPMLAIYENDAWNTSAYFIEGECFYTRCADYELTLHVPERYEVIASGEEIKGETADGMTEWMVRAESMRDVSVVISNEYEMISDKICGVTVNSWYAPNAEDQEGDDHEEQGAISLQAALDSIEAFTAAYGEYPYGELDVVESNYGFGGMEAPGLVRISQMYSWFIGEDDSQEDQAEYAAKCAGTVAHEVAHEWFYGVVGNDQYSEAWLDESFAAFSEQVYWRHVGRTEDEIRDSMKSFVEHQPASGDMAVDRAYNSLNSERHFDYTSAVYQRGAGFLYQLEQCMGEEFYAAVKEYYAAFFFREAHTEDFLEILRPYIAENEEAQALVVKYLSKADGMF